MYITKRSQYVELNQICWQTDIQPERYRAIALIIMGLKKEKKRIEISNINADYRYSSIFKRSPINNIK